MGVEMILKELNEPVVGAATAAPVGSDHRPKRSAVDPKVEPAVEGVITGEQRFAGLALEGQPPVVQQLVEVQADDTEVEAVNREEEIVKKRKTELTTTRQIETRVKRQLLFEDGKVVEDSGPIVSTNTTEDTDKQETVQTEHRTLGDPAAEGESGMLLAGAEAGGDAQQPPVVVAGKPEPGASLNSTAPKTIGIAVARADGLLRNIKEEVVVSREETKERTEVTEQKHFGDFTDDAYLRAINSGVDDIRELLLSEKARTELTPSGPQLIQQSISSRKVVDSEDTDIRHLARPDGTLVTEKQQTRQHEELYDDELPEVAEGGPGPGYDQEDSGEQLIEQKSSAQRYYKQRDEQHVDLVAAGGEVIGHEMRYAAEQTQMEKDGGRAGPVDAGLLSDWDSLSDRLRKARRLNRHAAKETAQLAGGSGALGALGAVAGVPGANAGGAPPATLNDRLDALTKKPLDFDKEEETRKQETSKWLESHFGSESRSSRDSREDLDELVEPTKKTYFNVTIKSGDTLGPAAPNGTPELAGVSARERDLYSSVQQQQQQAQRRLPGAPRAPGGVVREAGSGSKAYYQGISEWSAAGSRSQPYGRGPMGGSREDLLLLAEAGHAGRHSGGLVANGASERSSEGRDFRDDPQDDEYRQGGAAYMMTAPRPLAVRAVSGGRHFAARYGRSVSPDRHSPTGHHASDTARPLVPQRRKVLERRQQQQQQQQHQQIQQHQQQQQQYLPASQYHGGKAVVHQGYPSAPRSRSISPIQIPPVASTLRKPYQKTRFSSIQDLSRHACSQQSLGQHSQHQPPRATSRAQSTPPKANRVGSAIGNSIRKLMGKIRSASSERKHKSIKGSKEQQQQQQQQQQYKHQQRSHSPASSTLLAAHTTPGQHKRHSATYQQYNVIDGHISSNDSPLFGQRHQHSQHHYSQQQLQYAGDEQRSVGGRSAVAGAPAGSHRSNGAGGRRDSERDRFRDRRGSSDIISDMTTGSGGAGGGGPTPRQKYYLGENPYGGSIFGKENKYNPAAAAVAAAAAASAAGRERRDERNYSSSHTRSFSQPPQTVHHTLGRFSKSTNRLPTTSGDGSGQYEPGLPYGTERQSAGGYAVTSQTLPRNDHHRLQRSRPLHSSTINVSIVNTVSPGPAAKSMPVVAPLVNTGPIKPARTYKALSRSKSFNVHGLNGTNDPSPIYLEKLGRAPPTSGGGLYRSNFHLEAGSGQPASRDPSAQLKSPSIVNLISRSSRDLTHPGQYEDGPVGNQVVEYPPAGGVESAIGPQTLDKKNVFLRNLQNRAPELYRTLHDTELGSGASSPSKEYLGSYITREQEHLLGSRSPATLTKDTASIARRGSSSPEDYPDATNAKKSFYRQTAGRGMQALAAEVHTAVSSRYRGDSDLKYQDVHGPNISSNGTVDGVVIELRSNS